MASLPTARGSDPVAPIPVTTAIKKSSNKRIQPERGKRRTHVGSGGARS
jgi:hypothetical protein